MKGNGVPEQVKVSNVVADKIWGTIKLKSGPEFKPASQQTILLCGWPGAGKSTICLSIPRCLVLDTEYGSDELLPVHQSSSRLTVTCWEQMAEVLDALEKDSAANGPNRRFDTVAIDTIDGLGGSQTSVIAEYVVREAKTDFIGAFGREGSGWSRMHELLYKTLLRLRQAGLGIVMTCHLRRKQITGADGTSTTIVTRALTDRVDAMVRNSVSFIATVAKVSVPEPIVQKVKLPSGQVRETQVGLKAADKHYIYWRNVEGTSKEQEDFIKCRVPMKAVMEFSPTDAWQQFVDAYNAAVEERKAQLSQGK